MCTFFFLRVCPAKNGHFCPRILHYVKPEHGTTHDQEQMGTNCLRNNQNDCTFNVHMLTIHPSKNNSWAARSDKEDLHLIPQHRRSGDPPYAHSNDFTRETIMTITLCLNVHWTMEIIGKRRLKNHKLLLETRTIPSVPSDLRPYHHQKQPSTFALMSCHQSPMKVVKYAY